MRNGFVPRQQLPTVHDRALAGAPVVFRSHLDLTTLKMETPGSDGQSRRIARLDETFGVRVPRIAAAMAASPRTDDAELPAKAVLHRRRTIRVQDVSLVHHRIGDPLGIDEWVAHRACSDAASVDRAVRIRISLKDRSISARARSPPLNPRQWVLMRPTRS
jgi:hypothetical protein